MALNAAAAFLLSAMGPIQISVNMGDPPAVHLRYVVNEVAWTIGKSGLMAALICRLLCGRQGMECTSPTLLERSTSMLTWPGQFWMASLWSGKPSLAPPSSNASSKHHMKPSLCMSSKACVDTGTCCTSKTATSEQQNHFCMQLMHDLLLSLLAIICLVVPKEAAVMTYVC